MSFCVPTYGRAHHLEATLRSALVQTVPDFEIVVVDDCSPDETESVVRSIGDDRIRYLRNEKNLGVPENLNRALALGRGEHLVLLEDHDLLEPEYLEATLEILRRHPGVGFVATAIVIIDEAGGPVRQWTADFPEVTSGRRLLRRLLTHTTCPFSVTTTMRRSALAGLEPLFDARYWWYADQYLWFRLAAKADFGYVPRLLLKMREREQDHHLYGRERQTFEVLDRIHRDCWSLLHPRPGLRSAWDRLLYERAKLWEMIRFRAIRSWRRESWTEEDERLVRAYLSPPSRALIRAVDWVPVRLLDRLRGWQAAALQRRTRIE